MNFGEVVKAQMLMNQQNPVYGFIILTILEFFTGFFKSLVPYIKKYLENKMKEKINTNINIIAPKLNEIYYERDYTTENNWDQADAILHKILKIPEAKSLMVIGDLELINNKEIFNITQDIKFQLKSIVSNEEKVVKISFKIFSDGLSIIDLHDWVDTVTEEFLIHKKNNFGNKRFYFDHIVEKAIRGNIPKLSFGINNFVTNRTLTNVFHESQEELKERVELFINDKNWYDKRGVPHTLGLLLYGSPGTGKTSTIKAIANRTKRHIININLSQIHSVKQLKKLFYDERITVCPNTENRSNTVEYIIPINKRIYVIEDIDCLEGDIVSKRSEKEDKTTLYKPIKNDVASLIERENNDENTSDLDLSSILNVIDGTLETPGRILIISSNYPEKLDEALIRPGRIDMVIEFKKCNLNVIKDLVTCYFESSDFEGIDDIKEYCWTPAEVGKILFRNLKTPQKAIDELVNSSPEEEFKFSHFKK